MSKVVWKQIERYTNRSQTLPIVDCIAVGQNKKYRRKEKGEKAIIMTDESGDECVWINLEALVLENKGAELLAAGHPEHPTLGRVVVATKDLGADLLYQSMVKEIPALVCRNQDYMDFMEKFMDVPEEIQLAILDMFCQPLDSPQAKSLLEPAKVLFLLGACEDLTLIHQLLTIVATNGHQYQDNCTALPLLGSKFPHSCDPNLGYCHEHTTGKSSSSDKNNGQAVDYVLLKPVKRGDILSISYLTDLLETPTNERRKLLQETKSFVCACDRCQGPDYLRCLPCPTCSTLVPCQYAVTTDDDGDANNQSSSHQEFWECSQCGMLDPEPFVVLENSYARLLKSIQKDVERKQTRITRISDYSPSVLEELVTECEKELSPTHHLTMLALRLWFTASTAAGYLQLHKRMVRGKSLYTHNTRAFGFFRSSVEAGLKLVWTGECVAANCSTGYCSYRTEEDDDKHRHAPQFDRSFAVKNIGDSLLHLPVFYWPPETVTTILRYLPILRARYGDDKVDNLYKSVIQPWEGQTCLECGTANTWDAFQHQSILMMD